jgi:hypothetical protein
MREQPCDAPIFIGGLSYSGKTQLRQLLEAHPDLSLQRRTGLWAYTGSFGNLAIEANRSKARQVLESEGVASVLTPDWDRVFAEFEQGQHSYARLFGIVNRQHAEDRGRRRWGEQYGSIVNYSSEIFAAFPEARIIHMIRHPRGRLSRMEGRRRPGWMGLEAAAGIDSLRLAQVQRARHPNRYMVLDYEQLRENPVGSARRMLGWIDEPGDVVIDSSLVGELRFDPVASPETESRVEAFASAAAPDWPVGDISSHGPAPSEDRHWGWLLRRFPVDALVLWYRLYMSDRGENR